MLDETLEAIGRRSSERAEALLEQVLDATDSLRTMPDRGRVVPELAQPNLREIFVGKYRLMYRVRPDLVEIVTFVYGPRPLT